MKFIPFADKIVIEPIKKTGVIVTDDRFLECGKVIAVGTSVTFLKVGDEVYFDAFGHASFETPDGEKLHVISCNEEVIYGKYEHRKK